MPKTAGEYEIVQFLLSSGNWFPVNRAFWGVMKRLDALFLQDILNRSQASNTVRDREGYFLCTSDFLSGPSGWSKKELESRITKLRKMSLIETRIAGSPPKRWLRVKSNELLGLLRRAMERKKNGDFPPIGGNRFPPSGGTNKDREPLRVRNTQSAAHSPPSASVSLTDDEGGEGMYDGMFPAPKETTPAKKGTPPAPVDWFLAGQLKEALTRRLGMRTGWNRTKWADEFRRLRVSLSGDTERLMKVLDWYSARIGDDYVPEALCAAAFRSKFPRIESQMAKQQRDSLPTKLSPQAQKIAEHLSRYAWPKGSSDKLPGCVQLSIDRYAEVCSAFEKHVPSKRNRLMHEEFRRNLGGAASFVREWFERVWADVNDWADWSGNLTPWAFGPKHKWFDQWGRDLAGGYTGDEARWESYRKEVGV